MMWASREVVLLGVGSGSYLMYHIYDACYFNDMSISYAICLHLRWTFASPDWL